MSSVFDEVRGMQSDPDGKSGPSVFDEVRSSTQPPVATSAPPGDIQPTWMGAAKGVGEGALTMASGGLKAITHAVNDLLPDAIGGEGSRAAVEKEINRDPILNYQPQTEEGKYLMGKIRTLMTPVTWAGNTAHDFLKRSFGERTADVAGDVTTLAPFAVRDAMDIRGMASQRAVAIEEGHPLSGAAEEESGRLADMKSRAEDAGFDLPEGGTAERHANASVNNRPLVNDAAREELDLPKNAPLTPNMMERARQANVRPAYQAIENLKEDIPLDRAALDEARTANMNAAPNERLPFPKEDTLTGAEAVDFSKKARYLANQLEKNVANPFAKQDAQMYRDAAEAVENSVESHLKTTGREQLSADWDNARVYAAKSYSVESALDGAGNVRASDLKSQLLKKGKPLTGGLEDIANLAAQYPEAFRTTRVTMPRPGLIRKGIAAAAPIVGGAVGSSVAGTPGAAAGAATGEYVGSKIVNR